MIYENDEYDLLKDVTVTDNSGEKIEATVSEQNVDNKKAGEYSVKYLASDSSGNQGEKQINVTVKQKWTFSKLKKAAKQIVKDKKLDKLAVRANSDTNTVWVESKSFFDITEKKDSFYYMITGWAILIEDNKLSNGFIDIFQGDNILFNIYTNDNNSYSYKISKKERKTINQLVEFYNELNHS